MSKAKESIFHNKFTLKVTLNLLIHNGRGYMGEKYVYIEYDPALANHHFPLVVRGLVHTIELTRFVYGPVAGTP